MILIKKASKEYMTSIGDFKGEEKIELRKESLWKKRGQEPKNKINEKALFYLLKNLNKSIPLENNEKLIMTLLKMFFFNKMI